MTNIKDRLGLDTFKLARESHLQVNKEVCKSCEIKCCLYVCPAGVYTLDEQGDIRVEFEACLECGTCLIACTRDAIQWNYPGGGCGVHYKYG